MAFQYKESIAELYAETLNTKVKQAYKNGDDVIVELCNGSTTTYKLIVIYMMGERLANFFAKNNKNAS